MQTTRWVAAVAALVLLVTGVALTQLGFLRDGEIPTIDAKTLARSLEIDGAAAEGAEKQPPLLVVDVRSEAEFAVSMIPGAVTKAQFEANAEIKARVTAAGGMYDGVERYADHRIVPYCTVGVRSGAYTRELRERGLDAVNFDGSIIGWVEEGLPLVTPDGAPTRRVHTWSKAFEVPEGYVQITN